MEPVFADTSFYLALLWADDSLHAQAMQEARLARSIVTTDAVLLELGAACSRVSDRADFLALVAGLRATKRVRIIPTDRVLFDRGLQLFSERIDKEWSLTDCISFVVMSDLDIPVALTADRHFAQAGFQTLLV